MDIVSNYSTVNHRLPFFYAKLARRPEHKVPLCYLSIFSRQPSRNQRFGYSMRISQNYLAYLPDGNVSSNITLQDMENLFETLVAKLHKGIVSFVFRKKDCTKRHACGTLYGIGHTIKGTSKHQQCSYTLAYYDIDCKG